MLRIETLNRDDQTLNAREMSGVMGGRRRRVVIYNTTTTYTVPVFRPIVPVAPIIRVLPPPTWTVYPYAW